MPPAGLVHDPQVGIPLNPQLSPLLNVCLSVLKQLIGGYSCGRGDKYNCSRSHPRQHDIRNDRYSSLQLRERAKDLESGKITALSIYTGSAIYTMSKIGIVKAFQVKATLGLTLYIPAYSIGPMFLTPLQEMASHRRNPVYIIGLAIFILFNVPIVVSHNFSILLTFRFFTGFIGSPV